MVQAFFFLSFCPAVERRNQATPLPVVLFLLGSLLGGSTCKPETGGLFFFSSEDVKEADEGFPLRCVPCGVLFFFLPLSPLIPRQRGVNYHKAPSFFSSLCLLSLLSLRLDYVLGKKARPFFFFLLPPPPPACAEYPRKYRALFFFFLAGGFLDRRHHVNKVGDMKPKSPSSPVRSPSGWRDPLFSFRLLFENLPRTPV